MTKRATIIGGGAAGFFLAIRLKSLCPKAQVVIQERTHNILAKVKVSGGGRCNCTNTFEGQDDLANVYPRGHRLMRRLFHTFSPADAFEWFTRQGVRLSIMSDGCVFPSTQKSETIINCLVGQARQLGVEIVKGRRDISIAELLRDGGLVAVCTGGGPRREMFDWLGLPDAEIVSPVPSLFTLTVKDQGLNALMGSVANNATVSLATTSFKANGPLLLTHWGVSGPATLKLSSYAARHLAEVGYNAKLVINWTSASDEEIREMLTALGQRNAQKVVTNAHPESLSSRLWEYLATKALPNAGQKRWAELGRRDVNRLVSVLTADVYDIAGRAPFKDEFVTAGGVSLSAVDAKTLESKSRRGVFFAGEVLDIDGVTGGYNFQAAWTTAWVAAGAMAERIGGKFICGN